MRPHPFGELFSTVSMPRTSGADVSYLDSALAETAARLFVASRTWRALVAACNWTPSVVCLAAVRHFAYPKQKRHWDRDMRADNY